jgi:hypothetical protein
MTWRWNVGPADPREHELTAGPDTPLRREGPERQT